MSEAIKKRNEAFEEAQGKGRGRVLKSMFKQVRTWASLEWVRDRAGEITTSLSAVSETVQAYFSDRFKTRVQITQRWASWAKLLDMEYSG